MKLNRVVVTGIGALTPLGNNYFEFWKSLINGISGAAPITLFDTTHFKTNFACEIKNYNPENYFNRKEIKKLDRCSQLGIIAAQEAIKQSRIIEDKSDKSRIGVIWGSGIGGLKTFEEEITSFVQGNGIPRFNPFFIPKMISDITPGNISIQYGFHGPNYATVSACASSANALIDARMLIQLGKADVIVTGGSEAAITVSGVGGFNALNALSTRNDDYKTASRPFDKDRDGFVLGEGAGCLVIEEYQHAIKRGATIYAEFIGVGLTADAYHMTAPHPDGLGAFNVMKATLEDSGVSFDQIDTINMHGTSTLLGDLSESQAIIRLFGDHAHNIQINSTKSMTGHLLGGAGIIEAISCIGSINHSIVPPTINHFTDDEQINSTLDFTFNFAKKREINYAMSNTFGFGGHNACILFKKL